MDHEKQKECQRILYREKQSHIMKSLTWIKGKKEYLRKIYTQKIIKELLDLSSKYSKLLSLSPGLADRKRFENILKRDHFIVYLLGEINVGKSTLINALLGRNVMWSSVNPSSARRCHIAYGEDYVNLEYIDGKSSIEKLDKLKSVQMVENRENVDKIKKISVYLKDPLLEAGIELVDTPGSGEILVTNKNKNLIVDYKSDQEVQESSAVIYIVHARSQNMSTLKDLASQKKFVVVNQIDILKSVTTGQDEVDDERQQILNHITQLCSNRFSMNTHIHGISAKEALLCKLGGTKIPDTFSNFENDLYTFIDKNFRVETSELVFDLLNIMQISLDICHSQFEYQMDDKKKVEAIECLKVQAKQLKDEYKKIVEKNTGEILKEVTRLLKDKNILNGIINRCIECPKIIMDSPIDVTQEKTLVEQFYQVLKYYLDGAIVSKSSGSTIIEKVVSEFIQKVKEMIYKLEQKDSLLDSFCARYWQRVEQDLSHNYTIETRNPEKEITLVEKIIGGTQYVLNLIGIKVSFQKVTTDWIIKNATFLWEHLDPKDITIEIMDQFVQKGFSNLLISQKISDFDELYKTIFSRVSSSFQDWSAKAKYQLALHELEASALYNILSFGQPEVLDEIGKSPQGVSVLRGKWKGKDIAMQKVVFDYGQGVKDPTSHVIKIPDFESSKVSAEIRDLFLELYYSRILSHQNILKFEGACLSNSETEIYLCTEFLENLEIYLKNNKLQYKEMITFAHDIAAGLNHIHNHGIIHRNLKLSNIFIDKKNVVAKVGDLGILKPKNVDKTFLKSASPEIRNGKAYSSSADVYSFGIIFAQILSDGNLPFLGNELIPVVPKGCEKGIGNILQSCWNADPKKRPKCSELVEKLSLIKSQIL